MGYHIVVVDDEPDIIQLVSIHLKKEGYTVDGFLNGSSPLRRIWSSSISCCRISTGSMCAG